MTKQKVKLSREEEKKEIQKLREQIHTKLIKGVYDRSSIEAWNQLILADTLCEYLTWTKGLNLRIDNNYDFGYTIADHDNREGYYLFIIRDRVVIKTKWIKTRKQIGSMIQSYPFCNIILFYPKNEIFRYYYYSKRYSHDDAYRLGRHWRLSEQEFIMRQKGMLFKRNGESL